MRTLPPSWLRNAKSRVVDLFAGLRGDPTLTVALGNREPRNRSITSGRAGAAAPGSVTNVLLLPSVSLGLQSGGLVDENAVEGETIAEMVGQGSHAPDLSRVVPAQVEVDLAFHSVEIVVVGALPGD